MNILDYRDLCKSCPLHTNIIHDMPTLGTPY